jgi:DNA-binding NarL/FixJ family response regulator
VTALTPRQDEAMRLVCRGLQNKEIAAAMGLSEHTVHGVMMRSIFARLGVQNRIEAVLAYLRQHPELLSN